MDPFGCQETVASCFAQLAECYRIFLGEVCSGIAAECERLRQSCEQPVVQCEDLLVPLNPPVDVGTAFQLAEDVCINRGSRLTGMDLLERGIGVQCCADRGFGGAGGRSGSGGASGGASGW